MFLKTVVVGPLEVNCYIIADEKSKDGAVIDAGDNSDEILDVIKRNKLKLKYIINTHAHFDHIGAIGKIKNATGAEFLIHEMEMHVLKTLPSQNLIFGIKVDSPPSPDRFLKDNEKLMLGDLTLKILYTPGHSPGGICIYADNVVFTGDTLFAGSIGRADLPGGDHNTLIASIKAKLLRLGDEVVVLPGHGQQSTIGDEREFNPFLSK